MNVIDEGDGLFPHYAEEGGASAEEVDGAADDIVRPTGMLHEVDNGIDTSHVAASTSTSGYLSPLVEEAPKDAKNRVSKVVATSLVASGATRLFGQDGIAAYDKLVDDLRAEYRERKAEIIASDCGVEDATYPNDATSAERATIDADRDVEVQAARVEEIAGLVGELKKRQEKYREDPLDAEAETAATRLAEGPTDEMLVELFAAGALPSSTVDMFSDIEFRFDEPPSDLEDMDNADLAAYLDEHEELLDNEQTQKLVEERIEELSAEDGESDGNTIYGNSQGSPSRFGEPYLSDAFGNLALVSVYGEYAQEHDLQLPDGGAEYLTSFYGVLDDEDATIEVADWLGESSYVEDWMTKAYANGLLELSDTSLNADLGYDAMPDEVWDAIEDIPKVEWDPEDKGYDDPSIEVRLSGGDGFRSFAELMGQATAEPSLVVATEMTESAGKVAGLISEELADSAGTSSGGMMDYSEIDDAIGTYGKLMQNVVDVASRNEEANELLLSTADEDHSDTKATLTNLYTFPWPDDGKAVAGYTDWIADARGSDDEYRQYLAERASAGFINYLTDTGGDGEPNTFKTLMQGAVPDETYYDGRDLSVGDVNPELVQGFGLVAGTNLDALGNDIPGHDTTYEDDGTVSVSLDDRKRLFTVIATDDTATETLSMTIGAYEQERLDEAIAGGDPADLQDVGVEANRLDGYMTGGMVNADLIVKHSDHLDAEEAYKQHMKYAMVGKAIVTTGLGTIPKAGGIVGGGAGMLYDELVTGKIEAPEPPDMSSVDIEKVASSDFVRTVSAYDFVAAQLRAGKDLPPEIDALLDDGELRPFGEYSSSQLNALDNDLANDEAYLDYVEKNQGAGPYEDVVINDNGNYDKDEVEDFLNGKDKKD